MRRSYFPGVCDSHFSGVSIFLDTRLGGSLCILAWVVLCGYSLGWFSVFGAVPIVLLSRFWCNVNGCCAVPIVEARHVHVLQVGIFTYLCIFFLFVTLNHSKRFTCTNSPNNSKRTHLWHTLIG